MAKLLSLFLVLLVAAAALVDAGPQRNSKHKKHLPKIKYPLDIIHSTNSKVWEKKVASIALG